MARGTAPILHEVYDTVEFIVDAVSQVLWVYTQHSNDYTLHRLCI